MKTELNLFQLSQKRGNYYLTEAERLDVLHRLQSGQKPAEICSAYGITKQTVSAIKIKAKKFGSVADSPRTGRPRVTTPLEDRHIYLLSVRSPKKTPKLIKSDLNLNVNRRTVRRRLNEFKLMPRMAATVCYVSDKNRKLRLKFAKKWSKRPPFWFRRVIWSDEKKFELMHAKRRVIVNRRVGQRYHIKFTKPTVKFGGGALMLWGCFSYHGVGALVVITGNLNQHDYRQTLEDNLQYSADLMGLMDRFVFQQDLARIHTAPAVVDFFSENQIEVMEWVAQSADFNPIENLWAYLDSHIPVTERCNKTRFLSAIMKTWNEIPSEYLKSLVNSVPNRLFKAIRSKGQPIGY